MIADELLALERRCLLLPVGDRGVELGGVGLGVLLEDASMLRIVTGKPVGDCFHHLLAEDGCVVLP